MSMMKSDLQNFCESFSELDLPMGNDGKFRQLKTTEAVAFTSLLFQTLFGFKEGNVYM